MLKKKLHSTNLSANMYICMHVCVIFYYNYSIQRQMFAAEITQKSKLGLTFQQSCYKVTLDREKVGMDRARKNVHQGNSGKTERCYTCARGQQNKTFEDGLLKWRFKVVLKVQLCERDLEEAVGSSCLFICVPEPETQGKRERKRTYVHIEVGLAGRPSMIQPHLSSPIRPLWPHTHISRWQVSLC